MCSDFEELLCKRILEICSCEVMPNKEAQIQTALVVNGDTGTPKCRKSIFEALSIASPDNKKHSCTWPCGEGKFTASCENGLAETYYRETGVNVDLLNNYEMFNKYIMKYFTPLFLDLFTPKIDIAYENNSELNLLELKYPHNDEKGGFDSRWHYLQGHSGDYKGVTPFKWPVLLESYCNDKNDNKFLTDFQEGAMFIDFLRLLHVHKALEKQGKSSNLYFVSFFSKLDFCCYDKAGFEVKINELLCYYLSKNFQFAITRGNRWVNGEVKNGYGVDIWETIKSKEIYHFHYTKGQDGENELVKSVCSEDESIRILESENDSDLVAILIKLEPELAV